MRCDTYDGDGVCVCHRFSFVHPHKCVRIPRAIILNEKPTKFKGTFFSTLHTLIHILVGYKKNTNSHSAPRYVTLNKICLILAHNVAVLLWCLLYFMNGQAATFQIVFTLFMNECVCCAYTAAWTSAALNIRRGHRPHSFHWIYLLK